MNEIKYVWIVIFGEYNSINVYDSPEKAIDVVCTFLNDSNIDVKGLSMYDERVTDLSYGDFLVELKNENHFWFEDDKGNQNIMSVERFEVN